MMSTLCGMPGRGTHARVTKAGLVGMQIVPGRTLQNFDKGTHCTKSKMIKAAFYIRTSAPMRLATMESRLHGKYSVMEVEYREFREDAFEAG